jgi:hypothetical protein
VDASFRVERTQSVRFPFRIAIEQDGRVLFAVRAQSVWPAPGGQIFCLRELEFEPTEPLEPVETVRVATLKRVGARLVVVLDRPVRKRCEFLVVRKERKDGSGTYEQVFFRTESALRAHRSRSRVELAASADLEIAIDVRERYPWRFPGARVLRRALPAGDYAVLREERLLAVVERKTFANLLGDFGALRAFHQSLAELEAQPRAALVIEAQYADFLNPERTRPWPAAHAARVLAEISALHPRLPVVYAGNRKLANHWTLRWFIAVAAESTQLTLVSEPAARYEPAPEEAGLDQRIRRAVQFDLPPAFRTADVAARVAGVDRRRVARVLAGLRREGRLVAEGRGPGARWRKV